MTKRVLLVKAEKISDGISVVCKGDSLLLPHVVISLIKAAISNNSD